MSDHSPILSPPPKLVGDWLTEAADLHLLIPANLDYLAAKAAQWGYDQHGAVNEAELQKTRDEELEACCEWLDYNCPSVGVHHLRAARRPEPPTLNSIALQMLGTIERDAHYIPEITDTIRKALEQARPTVEPVAYLHKQGDYCEVLEIPLSEDKKARGWTEIPLYSRHDLPIPNPTSKEN